MKKGGYLLLGVLLLSVPGFAQTGPHTISIGSGTGSLSVDLAYSWMHFDGDTATFDNGAVASGSTLWNLCWMIGDKVNEASYFHDIGFTAAVHTNNRPVDGSVATTATQVTNTGMTFPNSPGLTADTSVTVSQPTADDTARATWTWDFNNSGGSAIDLVIVWFADVDCYLGGTSYTDDLVGAHTSDFHAGHALAIGDDNGFGLVDLNQGILMDAGTVPTRYCGISDSMGSSYYWSNQYNYTGISPEIVGQIDDSLANVIEGDANSDGISDAGNDAGGVMQFDITVPAGGSTILNCYLTWGVNATSTDVADWKEY